MQRRRFLAQISAVGTVGLAGCSKVASMLPCGPGDDEINTVAENHETYSENVRNVHVEGHITELDKYGTHTVIDDGTGVAYIIAPSGYSFNTDIYEKGDCIDFEGTVPRQETWPETDADVVVNANLPD